MLAGRAFGRQSDGSCVQDVVLSVNRGLHAKQKRGTGCAPFCLRYARSAAFPQRTHLTQRRDYDNILGRVVHRDFLLAIAPGQFAADLVSSRPDLGQEVLITVAVENHFGFLRCLPR